MTYRGKAGRRTYTCKYTQCTLDVKDVLRGRPPSYCTKHRAIVKREVEVRYYQRNKARILKTCKAYRDTHKVSKAVYFRSYYHTHKEAFKEYNRRHYLLKRKAI